MTAHQHATTSDQRAHRRQILRRLTISLGVVLLGSALTFAYVASAYAQAVPAHVTVAGIDLGGLSELDARTKLQAEIDTVNLQPITVTVGDTTVSRTPAELGVDYDATTTVAAALAVGRSPSRLSTVWNQLVRLLGQPLTVPLQVTFDRVAFSAAVGELTTKLGTPVTDPRLSYTVSGLRVSEAEAGEAVAVAPLMAELDRRLAALGDRQLAATLTTREPTVSSADARELLPQLGRLIPSTTVTLTVASGPSTNVDEATLASWVAFAPLSQEIDSARIIATAPRANGVDGSVAAIVDSDAVASYLKTLASSIDQPAVDAKLTVKDGRATVFQASRDGRTLKQAEAVGTISSALVALAERAASSEQRVAPLTISLPVETTTAAITDATISSLGINGLIGTATTDFAGSPSNRVHNIANGVRYLSGLLVKPTEEFSTVASLGEIDDKTGYLPELVIKDNKTIPEFGGGLCQVSTTLFRAVLNAGLPVTARTNHLYRVVYYERGTGPGLDATIYDPQPDFRFRNDTPGWILVQGSVSGDTVTFELYGTGDGRVSRIDGPFTLTETPAPPDEIQRDESLPAGEKKQLQFPHPGATTTATYTVTRDGTEINRQVFNSSYKAMPAVWAEGPERKEGS